MTSETKYEFSVICDEVFHEWSISDLPRKIYGEWFLRAIWIENREIRQNTDVSVFFFNERTGERTSEMSKAVAWEFYQGLLA